MLGMSAVAHLHASCRQVNNISLNRDGYRIIQRVHRSYTIVQHKTERKAYIECLYVKKLAIKYAYQTYRNAEWRTERVRKDRKTRPTESEFPKYLSLFNQSLPASSRRRFSTTAPFCRCPVLGGRRDEPQIEITNAEDRRRNLEAHFETSWRS